MRYDETRKLLELIELLDWFAEQGYGHEPTWRATRLVQSAALGAAQGTLEDTIFPTVKR